MVFKGLFLQSCIGIMVTVILTLFFFKRQDHKLWRSLKEAFSDATKCCSEQKTNQKITPEDELEMEGMDAVNTTTEGTYRNPGKSRLSHNYKS